MRSSSTIASVMNTLSKKADLWGLLMGRPITKGGGKTSLEMTPFGVGLEKRGTETLEVRFQRFAGSLLSFRPLEGGIEAISMFLFDYIKSCIIISTLATDLQAFMGGHSSSWNV